MAEQLKTRRNCRSLLSRFNEINGRHEGTRTPDLYRVKAYLDRNWLKSGGADSQLWCPKRPSVSVIDPNWTQIHSHCRSAFAAKVCDCGRAGRTADGKPTIRGQRPAFAVEWMSAPQSGGCVIRVNRQRAAPDSHACRSYERACGQCPAKTP